MVVIEEITEEQQGPATMGKKQKVKKSSAIVGSEERQPKSSNAQTVVQKVKAGESARAERRKRRAEATERGIIKLSRIPHGFYEEELRKFFSQFGTVKRIKVSRSVKTGRSRGYAFVEFEYKEVADIAAEAMNNYLMFNRLVKCVVLEGVNDRRRAYKLFANSDIREDNYPAMHRIQERKQKQEMEAEIDRLEFLERQLGAIDKNSEMLEQKYGIKYKLDSPKTQAAREEYSELQRQKELAEKQAQEQFATGIQLSPALSEVFEKLKDRFPGFGDDEIVKALMEVVPPDCPIAMKKDQYRIKNKAARQRLRQIKKEASGDDNPKHLKPAAKRSIQEETEEDMPGIKRRSLDPESKESNDKKVEIEDFEADDNVIDQDDSDNEDPRADVGQSGLPAEKASTPVGKQKTPASKSNAPAGKLHTPVGLQNTPTGKPSTHTEKHNTPTGKPNTPIGKQNTPSGKPSIPAGTPKAQAIKPSTPVPKLHSPAVKPSTPSVKSTTPIAKPSTPVVTPSRSTEKLDTPLKQGNTTVTNEISSAGTAARKRKSLPKISPKMLRSRVRQSVTPMPSPVERKRVLPPRKSLGNIPASNKLESNDGDTAENIEETKIVTRRKSVVASNTPVANLKPKFSPKNLRNRNNSGAVVQSKTPTPARSGRGRKSVV